MNKNSVWIGVLVLGISLSSCASTQLDRQDASSSSMVELRESMVVTRAQITQTLSSLDALTAAEPDDLPAAYRQYSKDTDKIAEQTITMKDASAQMRRRGEEWMAGWQESQPDVNDPELKALSEQRRAETLTRLQNIERSLAEALQEFTPFVSNLQDVERVVGNELTPQSVSAVAETEVVQDATRRGKAAAKALGATIADLQVLLNSSGS